MSLLPSSYDSSASEDSEPRVVDVESEEADEVFAALSSCTARKLLNELHDSPAPPAELAARVDTSVQNVQYHLEKLEDAGAIEIVDTAYSEKGREMDVYAPADQALVIFAGDEEESSTLRTALSRLLGSLGIVALASAVIQALYSQELFPFDGPTADSAPTGDDGSSGAGGDDGTDATGDEDPSDGMDAAETDGTQPVDDSGGTEERNLPDTEDTGVETGNETEFQSTTDNLTETNGSETFTEGNVSENLTRATDAVSDGQVVTDDPQTTVDAAASLPPGLLFFVGGAFALCLVFAVLYYRDIR